MFKKRIIENKDYQRKWYTIERKTIFGNWKTLRVKTTLPIDCIGSCPSDYKPYWEDRTFGSIKAARDWLKPYVPTPIRKKVMETL